MRILVTNDDGIHSPGLTVAENIARAISDDVWVVAPENEQSGASHSLTLSAPLRMRKMDDRHYAVSGTPTDCVMMGCLHLLKDQMPGLIISGVNWGSNMADDVTYSGTIAGAMEGTLLGIRSIAMSLTIGFDPEGRQHWKTPLEFGPRIVEQLLAGEWPAMTLMNINYPDLAAADVKGIVATRQGRRDQGGLHIEQRADTWGDPYFWVGFERRRSDPPQGTDLRAIADGMISVTPLHLNLTHEATREALGNTLTLGDGKRLKDAG